MQNSPARTTVDVGSVIAGTYTIEAAIGHGGMGAVFLASHNRLPGKKVAIKMLHAEIEDEETLARFKREAQIASMLGHPNIVGVENFDVLPDGTPYLVLEYLPGETLAQRLRNGPLAIEQVYSIVRQVGSALAAAHRAGIVHRDLKPQNIFLVPTEFDGRVVEIAKVLDFGISKMRGSQTVKTQESTLLGTPQYMAPEQATGQHSSVDERTDIFAFGAIVYEMIAGHPAFIGESIPEVVFKVVYEEPRPLVGEAPTVPPAVVKAVQQALAKASAERFANVGEFVEAVTGQTLPPPRQASRPAHDSSAPSNRSNEPAAFDATVGSGDHAAAIGPRIGSAPTVASVSAPVVPAPSASSDEREAVPTRRRTGLIAVAFVGCAALAGVAYFALRTSEAPPKPEPPVVAVSNVVPPTPTPPPVDTPTPTPTPPTHVAAPPAPPPTHVATPPPVHTAKPAPSPPPPPKPDPEAEPEPTTKASADPTALQQLGECEHALVTKQWDKAKELANTVINMPNAGAGQKAHAKLMLGLVACDHDSDQEAAQRAYRQLSKYHLLRSRLVAACARQGLQLGQ